MTVLVQSTDQGLLSGSLGGADLGKQTLVAGTNKLTFKIAASAGDRTLTLTPLSPDGTHAGTATTLKLSAVPVQKLTAKKTKPKKKTAVKKTAKRR